MVTMSHQQGLVEREEVGLPSERDRAVEALIEAAVAWAQDTGDCHFCGLYVELGVHAEDCPVYPFDPPKQGKDGEP